MSGPDLKDRLFVEDEADDFTQNTQNSAFNQPSIFDLDGNKNKDSENNEKYSPDMHDALEIECVHQNTQVSESDDVGDNEAPVVSNEDYQVEGDFDQISHVLKKYEKLERQIQLLKEELAEKIYLLIIYKKR